MAPQPGQHCHYPTELLRWRSDCCTAAHKEGSGQRTPPLEPGTPESWTPFSHASLLHDSGFPTSVSPWLMEQRPHVCGWLQRRMGKHSNSSHFKKLVRWEIPPKGRRFMRCWGAKSITHNHKWCHTSSSPPSPIFFLTYSLIVPLGSVIMASPSPRSVEWNQLY